MTRYRIGDVVYVEADPLFFCWVERRVRCVKCRKPCHYAVQQLRKYAVAS